MTSSPKPIKIHTPTKGMYIFGKRFIEVFTSLLVVDFDARLAGVDEKLHAFIKKEFLVTEMKQVFSSKASGKIDYVYLNCIHGVLILENKMTPNKRWFKCFVLFSKLGRSYGHRASQVVYIYLSPEHLELFKQVK